MVPSAINISANFAGNFTLRTVPASSPSGRLKKAISGSNAGKRGADKPSICTADELHYVSVEKSNWKLALWRYNPSPKAPSRNHPLLLLPGVGTTAIGYDIAPGSSFARHMSSQGFDTWILEFQGSGLSTEARSQKVKEKVDFLTQSNVSSNRGSTEMAIKADETSLQFSGNEGLPGIRQNSSVVQQISNLSQRLLNIIEEGRASVPPQFVDLLEHFSTPVEDFQKQIDLMTKYDWDFDHHLEEELPVAMEYIRKQCMPKDGKLLAIGTSMGGILLYAMLSKNSCQGRDSEFASIITLGSSLDYSTSRSSLKMLFPLVDLIQALDVPAVPIGPLIAAAYPIASSPPYVMSWLNHLITAQEMLHPKLVEKLALTNFCTVPAKVLLQLSSALHEGGLCDRTGKFFYKDHLHKSDVPVLALAGDYDLICPPDAAYETAKLIPEHLLTYKVFGEPGGPHYAHFDLVMSRFAADQVYPVITEFLGCNDQI